MFKKLIPVFASLVLLLCTSCVKNENLTKWGASNWYTTYKTTINHSLYGPQEVTASLSMLISTDSKNCTLNFGIGEYDYSKTIIYSMTWISEDSFALTSTDLDNPDSYTGDISGSTMNLRNNNGKDTYQLKKQGEKK